MPAPSAFDLRRNPVAAYLQREGYRCEVVPWLAGAQCTLRYGTERWMGRGPDTEGAFEAALAALAPSKIVQALLREASAPPQGRAGEPGARRAVGG